ncbi:MAG: hypothetical protein DMG29_10130 [Acidobacteria bacterium]|nr:MAG: hypothetical protein DMG29_10130 [Acidobacteriota bacterium]
MRSVAILSGILFVLPGALAAQQQAPPEIVRDDRLAVLEQRVRALEDELSLLKEALKAARAPMVAKIREPQAAPPRLLLASAAARVAEAEATPPAAGLSSTPEPVANAAQAQAGPLPIYGGASAAAKALNPDISVIGDFLGAIGRNRVRPVPGLELHESEVGLQAIIDPYARGDFFISFGESGVNVEEGYLTFTSLPAGLVARVGKMRAAFGKVNMIHNHALEWTDRPLVTENLVGGEDGINDAGLSVTRILPAPKGIFLEGTAQVYRGDSDNVFTATGRKDVSYVGHLRGYRDLSESTNVDLGFSYAFGHNDVGSAFHTQLYGLDATLRWKPLRRSIYHSFLARTELVWSHRDQLSAALLVPETQRAFGFYTSGEYRLNRRWTVGARYDRSDRARQANLTDSGFSALLTYWPSEFSQVRGQYRFARYAEKQDANELRFQFLFVLGAHGAHPF